MPRDVNTSTAPQVMEWQTLVIHDQRLLPQLQRRHSVSSPVPKFSTTICAHGYLNALHAFCPLDSIRSFSVTVVLNPWRVLSNLRVSPQAVQEYLQRFADSMAAQWVRFQ